MKIKIFLLFFAVLLLLPVSKARAANCTSGLSVTCFDSAQTEVSKRCIMPFPPTPDQSSCTPYGPTYQAICSASMPAVCNTNPDIVGSGACCVTLGGGGATCQDDISNCNGPGQQTVMKSCPQVPACQTGIMAAPAPTAPQTTQLQDDLKSGKIIGVPQALQISIPGLNFSKINSVDEEGYLYIPWIAEYISAIYKFAIGIVSIIAVVMIIVQGVRIITSAGGEAQKDAYNKILQAIIGLAIAWGSFFILSTVNPDLVQFKALQVQYITPEPMPDYKANPDDATYAGDSGFDKQLTTGDISQYKGKGCGKNLAELAAAYARQKICQGTNHCANFVSRILTDSGCDGSYKSNGAGDLAKKLSANGWKLGSGHTGMQAGDIAFWGDSSKLSGGHVAILTGNGGQIIDSGWDMSDCWKNKNSIQAACGPFYPIGYKGTFPTKGDWAKQYASASSPMEVRTAYAKCVAQNGECAPVRGVLPESCNYCAKLGPITEFDQSAPSRQCIGYGKGWDPNTPTKGWDYYLKNPTNGS